VRGSEMSHRRQLDLETFVVTRGMAVCPPVSTRAFDVCAAATETCACDSHLYGNFLWLGKPSAPMQQSRSRMSTFRGKQLAWDVIKIWSRGRIVLPRLAASHASVQ
jgi:hypothetical protein